MKMTESSSDTFRIASLLATLLVIAIHYNTRHHVPLSEGIGWNIWLQTFLNDGLARIAVPYFAFSAGLFYFLGKQNFKKFYWSNIVSRFHSLLIPYVACISLIMVGEYIFRYYTGNGSSVPQSISELMEDAFIAPVAVQFWFLRDLIFLTVFSPFVALLSLRFARYALPVLLILWVVDLEILPRILGSGRPVISIEVLFFFCLGCHVSSRGGQWIHECLDKSKRFILTVVAAIFVLISLRVHADLNINQDLSVIIALASKTAFKLGILLGIYALLLVSTCIRNSYLLWLSTFNFFMYIFHGYPLLHVINFTSNLFVTDAYKFYFNFPIAVVVTFAAAAFVCHFFNPVYKFLVGGR